MKRSQFIGYLAVLPLVGILGCGTSTQNKQNEDFMGKAEGKSGSKAAVHFKVIDKDGNVKQTGVAEGEISGKSEQKIKRG